MENFNLTFNWINEKIGAAVHEALNLYFENNFDTALISIDTNENLKLNPLLKNELFYTCRISIKNKQHLTLRVTSDFIRIIFHDIFGSSYPVFDLEKLTELEQKILNAFFETIAAKIDEFLIKDTERDKIDPLKKENLNLSFLVKNKEVNCGKMGLSIPLNRIEPKPVKQALSFVYDDFIDNFAYVDIVSGHSKISLNDLKNLASEDILILEKSNIKFMTLKTPTIVQEFKVNLEPSIMLDIEDNEEEISEYKENNNMPESKSMWDDIQIEVSAEFKRVKMTLGELKQISKGLVIDLGAIMNNEISLLVENKAVAKGELVIINDKYGVKINEVFATQKPKEEPEEAPNAPADEEAPKPAPQAVKQQVPPPAPAPKPVPRPVPPPRPAQNTQKAQQVPPKPAPRPAAPKPAPKPAPPKPAAQGAKEDFDYSNFEE